MGWAAADSVSPAPCGPADPQPFGGGGHGLVKADLFPDHPVLKAVGQVHLLAHQGVPVGMGQQAGLARRGGEFPFRHPQHKDVIGLVQPHLARRGQHHCVQGLGDVPQIGRAQQQAEQFGVFGGRDRLVPQQPGHLVQQVHHHVPLPGGLLGGGDAAGGAQGFHLLLLGLFGPQPVQAEPQRPADLFRAGLPAAAAQGLQRPHQESAGLLGVVQGLPFFFGQLAAPKAPGALGEGLPPLGGPGGPGIGVVLQRAHLGFGQAGQAGLDQGGQLFGVVRAPDQFQQGGDRRCRGAERRGGGLIAPEGDLRHPELVPDGGPVVVQVPADHRDLAAAHPLGHQPADGARGGPGFLLPAGGGVQPDLRRRAGVTAAGGQKLFQPGQPGGIPMAQVPAQQQGRRHLGPVFPGQTAQLGAHRLGPREQPQIPRPGGRAVVAQGHRHLGQGGQHGPHQLLFGGVEGIELVDKDRPALQESGHPPLGQGGFQPLGGQLDPVGGVHAGLGQQGLIALVDHGQLGQAAALGAAASGQPGQLLPRHAGALELVDGLGGQLAEGGRMPVAVIKTDVVLQLLQGAAHQGHPPRVGEGLDGRAPLLREDPFGQAGEGKTLHPARAPIPQLAVDAPFGGRGELLRHQQDAGLPLGRPLGQLIVQPAGLAAAGASQDQFQHGSTPSFVQKKYAPLRSGPGIW